MKSVDSGQKFGKLTVIEKDLQKKKPYYICKCECGKTKSILVYDLLSGHTSSCGCNSSRHTIGKRKQRVLNKYIIDGDTAYVTLTDGSVMICDSEDWEKLKSHTWFLSEKGYAVTSKTNDYDGSPRFHLQILGKHAGKEVDHINRNKLDNRKCNLRICTRRENAQNQSVRLNSASGYNGVTKVAGCGTKIWRASIGVNRKTIFLGYYERIEDAINARKEAEKIYFSHINSVVEEKNK